MIIKHSARTPLCADHFVDAFAAAGAPEGLITSLHCDHDVVNAVIRNPLTAFVSFTGSVPGGHAVYVLARTLVWGDWTITCVCSIRRQVRVCGLTLHRRHP